jgi:hypothetical protein
LDTGTGFSARTNTGCVAYIRPSPTTGGTFSPLLHWVRPSYFYRQFTRRVAPSQLAIPGIQPGGFMMECWTCGGSRRCVPHSPLLGHTPSGFHQFGTYSPYPGGQVPMSRRLQGDEVHAFVRPGLPFTRQRRRTLPLITGLTGPVCLCPSAGPAAVQNSRPLGGGEGRTASNRPWTDMRFSFACSADYQAAFGSTNPVPLWDIIKLFWIHLHQRFSCRAS